MRLLLVLAALLWPFAARAADWREAETRHFRIVSSGETVELRKFAQRLELFHALLGRATGADESRRRVVKVRVFLVPSISYVQKLYGNMQSDVAGFYRPYDDGTIAVVPRSTGDGEFTTQVVLFHEYAHHYMLQYTNSTYPSWYVEGFAEIASTASFERNGQITFGKAAQHRQYELELGDHYPVAKMIDGSYLADQKRGRGWSYGDAWLLSHYLTFSTTRPGQFRAYLNSINAGQKPADAAQAFGDLARLSRDVSVYLSGRTFPYRAVPIAEDAVGEIELRRLSEAEAALIDQTIEFERRTSLPQPPEAGDDDKDAKSQAEDFPAKLAEAKRERDGWFGKLEAIINRYPGDPAGWRLLAAARCVSEQYQACSAAADRALALAPSDSPSLSRKAEAMIGLAADLPPAQRIAQVQAAQELLLKATAANIDDPLPLLGFYRSFAAMGRSASAEGLTALITAVQLVPQVGGPRLQLAHELVARGQLRDARFVLRPLAYSPHEDGTVRTARALLEEIEAKLNTTPN